MGPLISNVVEKWYLDILHQFHCNCLLSEAQTSLSTRHRARRIKTFHLKNVDCGIICFGVGAVDTQPEVDWWWWRCWWWWWWWWGGKLLLLRCVVTRNRAIVTMWPTRHQPSVHTHTVTHSDSRQCRHLSSCWSWSPAVVMSAWIVDGS